MIMSATTDPPSAERKNVEGWMRGFGRKFVTRKTLLFAFQIANQAVRLAEHVVKLFDGF